MTHADPSSTAPPSASDSGVPLGRALRRGWPVVVLIAAMALATGLYVASRQPVQYANTARLLVNPLSQASGQLLGIDYIRSAGDADRTAQTAAVLVESNEVAQEAARRLGGAWTRASVLEAVVVAPERESNVLAVTATTDDQASATQVANGVATAVVSLREQRIRRQIGSRLRGLRRDLRGTDSEDYAARDGLLDSIRELRSAQLRGDLSLNLAQTAVAPGETIRAPKSVIAVLALLGGLLLGVLAALLIDRLRGPARIRSDRPAANHQVADKPLMPADVLGPAQESAH